MDSEIVFPRLLKHKAKDGENHFTICSLDDITNDKLHAAVEKAGKNAKLEIERLEMADLLKKNSKWDCPKAPNNIDDTDDDNDDNDEDSEDDDKHDSDDVAVVQEVCCEEPSQVTTDIEQIVAKELVEDEVKGRLEEKQKSSSYNRIPSATIPMYACIESTKSKSKKCKNFSPFVEVKSDNGSTIFIKKTTAVWLIQESERFPLIDSIEYDANNHTHRNLLSNLRKYSLLK